MQRVKSRVFREFVAAAALLQLFGWLLVLLALGFALGGPRASPGEVKTLVAVTGVSGLAALGLLLAAHRTPRRRIVVTDECIVQEGWTLRREVRWRDRILIDEEIVAKLHTAPGVRWPDTEFWSVVRFKSPHQEVRCCARVFRPGVDPTKLRHVPVDEPGFLGVPLSVPSLEKLVAAVRVRIDQDASASARRSSPSAGSSQERR